MLRSKKILQRGPVVIATMKVSAVEQLSIIMKPFDSFLHLLLFGSGVTEEFSHHQTPWVQFYYRCETRQVLGPMQNPEGTSHLATWGYDAWHLI